MCDIQSFVRLGLKFSFWMLRIPMLNAGDRFPVYMAYILDFDLMFTCDRV